MTAAPHASAHPAAPSVRLDVWLWAARFFKTRSLAKQAIEGGKIDCNDAPMSVISLLRKGKTPKDGVLVACNFTPVPREKYRVGVPFGGYWKELLNSDGKEYAGSGMGNGGGITAEPKPQHGRPFSLELTLPPLAAVFFRVE